MDDKLDAPKDLRGPDAKPRRRTWNWFLWWRIDPAELEEQVEGYNSLGIFSSARKLSVFCLCLSMVATIAFVAFGIAPVSGYVDVAIFGVLALFIYFGHRWAMIVAMVIWTIEKTLVVVGGLGPGQAGAVSIVPQLIWWGAYMHAFYLAFRTEQQRRRVGTTDVQVF